MEHYEFTSSAEKIAEQAELGVRPIMKDLIRKRLNKVRDQLMEQATKEIDQLLADVSLEISKSIETRIISARQPMDNVVEIVIAIDHKPTFKRVMQDFVTEVPEGQ